MTTILVIDNDEAARNAIIELFETDPDNDYKLLGSDFDTFTEHIDAANIVVTDYKYDGENESAGLDIYERIRDSKFAPVIIYSGFIESIDQTIKDSLSPFLQIIEKGANSAAVLKEAVNTIVNSNEFNVKQAVEQRLISAVNGAFREYYWRHIQPNWREFVGVEQEVLERILTRKIIKDIHPSLNEEGAVHPIEFYEHPIPSDARIETGSIIKNGESFLVCINNDCDLIVRPGGSCKADRLYFLQVKEIPEGWSARDADIDTRLEKNLKILNNNGDKRESSFFLPKTFFFPGGYVTYGDISSQEIVITANRINLAEGSSIVAKIHSPFINRLISNFSNYYSRFGTPTIDVSGWPYGHDAENGTQS